MILYYVHFFFLNFLAFSTGGQLNKSLPFLAPTNNRSNWTHII